MFSMVVAYKFHRISGPDFLGFFVKSLKPKCFLNFSLLFYLDKLDHTMCACRDRSKRMCNDHNACVCCEHGVRTYHVLTMRMRHHHHRRTRVMTIAHACITTIALASSLLFLHASSMVVTHACDIVIVYTHTCL